MANIIYAFVNNTIVADQEYDFYLCFDSIDNNDESQLLRCHLYDSQFFLEYYLPEIPLSSMQKVNCMNSLLVNKSTAQNLSGNIRTFKIKFPAQLAGGTFRLDFYLQAGGKDSIESPNKINDIQSLNDFIAKVSSPNLLNLQKMTVYYNQISVDVTIESPSGPSFTDLYWGKNEDISYGKKSPTRSNTTVYSDELLHAHIHTEGMYGKNILIDTGNNTDRLATIKDNTLVVNLSANAFYNTTKNAFWVKPHDLSSSMYYGADITPSLSYNQGKALNIDSPVTSAEIVQTGAKTEDEKLSESTLCRVDFRPTENYDGSFGFSWYRVGDTQTPKDMYFNDNSFLENIGFQYRRDGNIIQDVNAFEETYKDSNQQTCYFYSFIKSYNMITNHMFDYQKILMPKMGDGTNTNDELTTKKYLVPQMTIRKGQKAELKLYVQSKEAPEKYCLEFSNPNAEKDGYLSLSEKDFTSLSTGKTIKIECKKEFSKSINLNMYAYPKDSKIGLLCGSIQILPNDIMHQRNIEVVLINVVHSSLGNRIEGKDETNLTQKNLQKYYNQTYVNIHVTEKEIVLDDPNDPCVRSYYNTHNQTWPMDIYRSIVDIDIDPDTQDIEECLINRSRYTSYNLGIFFMELTQSLSYNNKNCCKIVAIPLRFKSINGGQTNGFSMTGKNFILCFKGCKLETPAHELGHALGLPHTFTGCTSNAKYVYQYHSTDNIMDYSHQKKPRLGHTTPVVRQSFFHWQWKSLNALME